MKNDGKERGLWGFLHSLSCSKGRHVAHIEEGKIVEQVEGSVGKTPRTPRQNQRRE